MNKQTDKIETEWLVIRCQSGEPAAAEALVAGWQTRLVGFATVILGDRELAREAVQEAWIALFRGLPGLRDPATFRTWMFRIVNNKCIDLLRTRREQIEVYREPTGRMYLDQLEHREQVLKVLTLLSEHHRAVLALHYLQDMEVREIAESLQVPVGTIKSRLFHAREAFRHYLEAGEKDERTGQENSCCATAGCDSH